MCEGTRGVTRAYNLVPRAFQLLTAHARRKRRALERTGSKSPQIADLLYCITFQRTNQDHLRIGPFQSPSFSSSMRSKKLEGSVGTRLARVTSKNKIVGEVDLSISQLFRFCLILSVQIKCYGI